MTTYNKNTKVSKTDFKSYSIISLYVNSPQGEIPGPNILVPKVCVDGFIYCSIPVKKYGGNQISENSDN